MSSVCETCVGYVQELAAPDVQVCDVFDSYTIGNQRRLQSKNGGSLRLDHIQMYYKQTSFKCQETSKHFWQYA